MRYFLALCLIPVVANAGVVYDVSIRAVDQSNLQPVSPNDSPTPAVVTRYVVEDGKIRIGNSNAKRVYLFNDHTMYVIDNPAKVVHVLKHATLKDFLAHYAEAVKQLQDAAAAASPDTREEAQRKAADMQLVSDRMREPVPREYRVTVKFESVDGHACRVWEEYEKDAKRLELCVAPTATVAGGAEMLSGFKTLSQFKQGSNFAMGVDFGLSEWWPDIATLGGVPLLIREYKYDSEVSEVMLSAMRPGAQGAAQFEPPQGYPVQDGPDYAQWYVR